MHFIPQTVTAAPFRAHIPGISHLLKFGFKPVNDENISIVFRNFLTETKFFKKNRGSSPCTCVYVCVYLPSIKSCWNLEYYLMKYHNWKNKILVNQYKVKILERKRQG